LLPFQDQPEIVRGERILELQERKAKYLWGQLPTGVTDLPGFLHAATHDDIPRDSQFSEDATRAFNRGRVFGGINLALSCLYTLFDSWSNFESFTKIYTGWTGDAPEIARDDMWMKDEVFGFQFLNGCNPCVIERCSQLPKNFPVTDVMVKKFLDRDMTLTEEIKEGHVYIVDYKELEGIKRNGEDGNSNLCYAAVPLCLFYVKRSGDLVPIAIQLYQQPSKSNPIWTPDDGQYDWLLAKMWFRNADHQVHQTETGHGAINSTHMIAFQEESLFTMERGTSKVKLARTGKRSIEQSNMEGEEMQVNPKKEPPSFVNYPADEYLTYMQKLENEVNMHTLRQPSGFEDVRFLKENSIAIPDYFYDACMESYATLHTVLHGSNGIRIAQDRHPLRTATDQRGEKTINRDALLTREWHSEVDAELFTRSQKQVYKLLQPSEILNSAWHALMAHLGKLLK
ncbi:allene oxide synthase-lipoxygenase -like, partial [Paramuricea clavata]